jgi:hypothetical protein
VRPSGEKLGEDSYWSVEMRSGVQRTGWLAAAARARASRAFMAVLRREGCCESRIDVAGGLERN